MHLIKHENLIIIDIETASLQPDFSSLDDIWKNLWEEKVRRSLPDKVSPADFYPLRAGVMAEFSKIICISMGYFNMKNSLHLRVKSFYGHDEKILLQGFIETLNKIENLKSDWCFAGHNIKEFDIPFICRRLLINGLQLPAYLDFQNRKPWETNIVDTFQYWRFGDYKNYTSLKLLAATMGVPSPKDDIDGSMVGELYWTVDEEVRAINLERISAYCQKDVVTTGNIILRFKNMEIVHPEEIEIIERVF